MKKTLLLIALISLFSCQEKKKENSSEIARVYGFIDYEKSPSTTQFLNEGDIVEFGNSKLKILYTPGHAPGHISLYSKEEKFIISGDVLFKSSIGRTDLPGGDFNETASKANELVKKGFNPIPHFPARSIENEAQSENLKSSVSAGASV